MDQKRPSARELTNRVKQAKDVLKTSKGLFANPSKAVGELNAMRVGNSSEVWELLAGLLNEISAKDYCGARPPQKSYEKAIIGQELLAFRWFSPSLAKEMYLKFVLKNERFYYVSLHESKGEER